MTISAGLARNSSCGPGCGLICRIFIGCRIPPVGWQVDLNELHGFVAAWVGQSGFGWGVQTHETGTALADLQQAVHRSQPDVMVPKANQLGLLVVIQYDLAILIGHGIRRAMGEETAEDTKELEDMDQLIEDMS